MIEKSIFKDGANKNLTHPRNKSGITLIALVITIIVLLIIAGKSIATLTADNGILRQTNAAKVSKIEGDAREQVKLACAAMRLAVAEAHSKDNSYKANEHAKAIQDKLVEILQADKKDLTGNFSNGSDEATNGDTEITIEYVGNDYKNATNDTNAKITYTIGLNQKTVELKDEVNSTLKDSEGNDVNLDIGADSGSGSGSGEVQEPKNLSSVAQIGDYVNYDPTDLVEDAGAISYTSLKGTASSHGNGSSSQAFSATNYKNAGGKWQILDIDESGKITLISDAIYQNSGDTMGTTGLTLNGAIGYLYAEEELHRISAIFGYGKGADTSQTITYYYGGQYDQETTGNNVLTGVEAQQGRRTVLDLNSGARAIVLKDVNKIFEKETVYPDNYYSSTIPRTTKNAKYYPSINGTSSTGKSSARTSFSGSFYQTYNVYFISTNSSNEEQCNIIKKENNYWLATRKMQVQEDFVCYTILSKINESGLNAIGGLVGGVEYTNYENTNNWSPKSATRPVRALVTLQSGIQTNDTEYPGDDTTGWNFVK